MAIANMYTGVEPTVFGGGGYASMYTPEKISKLLGDYSSLLEPEYQRSRAQIANTLGGRGTLGGTPGSNKLQLLEGARLGQIGQYGMGLEQSALEEPYRMAELTGYLGGTKTLSGQELADKQRQAELDNLVSSLSSLEKLATAPGARQAAKDKYRQALWDYLGKIGLGGTGTTPTTTPPELQEDLLPETPAGDIGEKNIQKQDKYDQADLDFTYISKNLPGWASDRKQNTPVAKAWREYDVLATKLEKIQGGSALEMTDAELAEFNELSDAFKRYIAAGGDKLNNDPVFIKYVGGVATPAPVVNPTPAPVAKPVTQPATGIPRGTPRVGVNMRAF